MSAASTERGISPTAALAAVAAVLGAGAMLLPWFSINEAAMSDLLRKLMGMGALGNDVNAANVDQMITFGMAAAQDRIVHELIGFRVFSQVSVIAYLLGAVVALVVATKIVTGQKDAFSQRAELAGAAFLLLLRPIIGIINSPFPDEALKQLALKTDLLQPASGLYLGLFSGLLMLVAALLANSSRSAQPAQSYSADGAMAPPGDVSVPSTDGGAGGAADAQQQPAAAFAPTGAYIPAGPPATAAPVQAAPETAVPSQVPLAPPADRSGSVAPPGMN